MRWYLLSLLRIFIRKEQKYGLCAAVAGLLFSVVAWIPLIVVKSTLSTEFSVGNWLANLFVILVFSPAIILFYVSFALVADEISGCLTGRTVFGKQPGSLRRRLRKIVGVDNNGL